MTSRIFFSSYEFQLSYYHLKRHFPLEVYVHRPIYISVAVIEFSLRIENNVYGTFQHWKRCFGKREYIGNK